MSMLSASNDRAVIGGNRPPSPIDMAMETAVALSNWLGEHPVILNEDAARDAKVLLERFKATAGEVEDARLRETKPLNEKLAEINGRYKAVHNTDAKNPGTLNRVAAELRRRMTDFFAREEARRMLDLEKKRKAAEVAEQLAREAEAREREAIENANAGELGVDVTQVVVEADSRYSDFKKAGREVARAERDAHVRIGGGWGRAATLRNKEILTLDDPIAAVAAVELTEKLTDAILSAARDFRKTHGCLPAGVSSVTERHI